MNNMEQKHIILHKQTLESFEGFLQNYRFTPLHNKIVLFWQPYNNLQEKKISNEKKLELILEHDGVNVDSHCYISPDKDFNESINFYKQLNTVTVGCTKCSSGKDITFSKDGIVPTIIKDGCPNCGSDLLL